MKKLSTKLITLLLSGIFLINTSALAEQSIRPNILDELDPTDPRIEKILEYYDNEYFKATGQSAIIKDGPEKGACHRSGCAVWANVSIAEQKMDLYVNGVLTYTWQVSTGKRGKETPSFDQHPNGRIYDKYSSTIYPGGDYNGLGNMPYAVFIRGGYAIHGTTESNWPLLGTPVSGGCIRLHPDYGFIFNRLIRKNGIGATWITVF